MSSFNNFKATILHNINSGIDHSYKGSIDLPIMELVMFINNLHNYYTTSSCSGRISVFENGIEAKQIKWLLVKHRLILKIELIDAIETNDVNSNLIVLKCEPFILHINCRDVDSAKELHEIATVCGFRESGIKIGIIIQLYIYVFSTIYPWIVCYI